MRKPTAILTAISMAAILTVSAAGCSSASSVSGTAASSSTETQTTEDSSAATADSSSAETASEDTAEDTAAASVTSAGTGTVVSDTLIDTTDLFSERDLEQSADTTDAVSYTVESGSDITITEAGVYIISGTATDCSIIVDCADEDAKVQIVLDGVSITNTDTPVIYVKAADKCFVTTTDSTNTLSVTGTFTSDGETNTDAVIFSKADLVLNGTGTLNISSTGNGITSKDDLKVTGGTYSIECTKNGLEGKDSIAVCGGSFTINSGADGLHSENSDDNTLGSIYISGGTFDITSGDDGIHGTTAIVIDGGEFSIDAVEGIEATYIRINDGTISINASDDGINAAAKSTAYDVVIELNGGTISIVMGSGDTDAVDANGSIYVNGGNITITGNSSFDYDTTGELNGGTVIVNGEQITEMPAQMMGGGMAGGMGKGSRG
jgi:hypothetical protein